MKKIILAVVAVFLGVVSNADALVVTRYQSMIISREEAREIVAVIENRGGEKVFLTLRSYGIEVSFSSPEMERKFLWKKIIIRERIEMMIYLDGTVGFRNKASSWAKEVGKEVEEILK